MFSHRTSSTGDPSRNDFDDEFHRLLGRLIHAHARFDFNIGLQLNYLGPHVGEDVSVMLDPRQSQLNTRLKKLKQIVMKAFRPAGTKALKEFSEWFKQAHEARALRNDYAHGRWGVPGKFKFKPPGRMIDAEPLLTFMPLHWNLNPDRPDDSLTMTLEEFAAQVATVEKLFSRYWELSEKYLRYVGPATSVTTREQGGKQTQ